MPTRDFILPYAILGLNAVDINVHDANQEALGSVKKQAGGVTVEMLDDLSQQGVIVCEITRAGRNQRITIDAAERHKEELLSGELTQDEFATIVRVEIDAMNHEVLGDEPQILFSLHAEDEGFVGSITWSRIERIDSTTISMLPVLVYPLAEPGSTEWHTAYADVVEHALTTTFRTNQGGAMRIGAIKFPQMEMGENWDEEFPRILEARAGLVVERYPADGTMSTLKRVTVSV